MIVKQTKLEYVKWKKKQLGEEEFKVLELQHNLYKKKDRKLEYLIAKQLLEELKRSNQIKELEKWELQKSIY